MAGIRKPFQGVLNIIRFNWHFYVIAFTVSVLLLGVNSLVIPSFQWILNYLSLAIILTTFISLLASFYVYDYSGLYKFKSFPKSSSEKTIVNINAGFDETSEFLQEKYKNATLIAMDFYDPKLHTEISIKRARKAYPPYSGTNQIKTNEINLSDKSVDKIFLILSAHEIRNIEERILFFKELNRILNPEGEIIVVEHLRDLANLLAYNIGFFHFFSKKSWQITFEKSDFKIKKEIKTTPFISTFIIAKNGNTF